MRKKTLSDGAPGKYVPYHPQSYYSPDRLPPAPELAVSDEVQNLIADAAYQLGRVDGISSTVDFSAVLYTSRIRIEAVESARIEGADVDYEDVESYRTQYPSSGDGERVSVEKDLQEALNYEDALTYGIRSVRDGENITVDMLKELHKILLDGVHNDGDVVGDFRDHMVHLRSPNPARDAFVPPSPESLGSLMASLESYIQRGSQYHPLVDAAIIHYFFETVHPFSDGNGRLGRLLIILYLMSEGYPEILYISPSVYFNRHKVEYVERMRAVSERGEWNEWLSFFIEGLRSQGEISYDRTWKLRELQSDYVSQYMGENSTDKFARQILQFPYFTAKDLMEFLEVSRGTAYKVIQNLENEGIIEETTGKEYGQEYKAVDVFNILW